MKTSIAAGNTKIRKNIQHQRTINLPKKCTMKKQCYSKGGTIPERNAWPKTQTYKQDPEIFKTSATMQKKKIERFRWHVGGTSSLPNTSME